MGWYDDRAELNRYIAELKKLLSGTGLSPDTRARSLAALIEASAMTLAADQVHTAAAMTRDDTMPLLHGTARLFAERAEGLTGALQRFNESASQLSLALRRLPGY